MVAWLIAGSQAVLGSSEFAVRASFWAMGAALPGLVYLLGRRLYDGQTGAKAALLLTGAPLMAGGALATPDMPLVFFWTLADGQPASADREDRKHLNQVGERSRVLEGM